MKPKQRRRQIQQRQLRRQKRRKSITLTKEERERINKIKQIQAEPEPEEKIKTTHFNALFPKGIDDRRLWQVDNKHGVRFATVVRKLSKKFHTNKIEVLDEGAGKSTFYKELPEKLKGEVDVKVTRTDIRKDVDAMQTSPEELVERFGRNRFHLVVSTFGGTHYTEGSQAKAIANIITVLKPGGEAYITTSKTIINRRGLRKILKLYKNVVVTEEPALYGEIRIRLKKLY